MRALVKNFLSERSGTLSVETVFAFPMLVWLFGALLVFWDAYRLNGEVVSATYVIGDIISREEAIDTAFVDGLDQVFEQLITGEVESDIRVTMIRFSAGADPDNDPPFYEMLVSDGTGKLTDRQDIDNLAGEIPQLAIDDTVVYVEVVAAWTPFLRGVLSAQNLYFDAFITPRFTSVIPIAQSS